MLNNTPSYPALLAAKKAWLAVFKNPSASQALKDATQAAYKAAVVKCIREANILGVRGR